MYSKYLWSWLDEHEMGCSCEHPWNECNNLAPCKKEEPEEPEELEEPAEETNEDEMGLKSWEKCRDIMISQPDFPKTKEDAKFVQALERAIYASRQDNNDVLVNDVCYGCNISRKHKDMISEDSKIWCSYCFTYIDNDIFLKQKSANHMLNSYVTINPNSKIKIPPICSFSNSSSWLTTSNQSSIQPRNVPTTSRSVLKSQAAINIKPLSNPRRNISNNTAVTMSTQNPIKNLESDGDSVRSYSPQSTLTDPEDDEIISFRHDSSQIFARDISGKLSEYISNGAAMASMEAPKNKVTNQRIRRSPRYVRRKEEESQQQAMNEIQKNTLSDHCYHLSQDTSSMQQLEATSSESDEEEEEEEVKQVKKEEVEEVEEMEEMEEMEEEDEEDEIDVVSLGKKPRYYNRVLQEHHQQPHTSANQQLAVSTNRSRHPFLSVKKLGQQPAASTNQLGQQSAVSTKQLQQQPAVSAKQLRQQSNTDKTTVRRPRGRPPGPNSLKRKCQTTDETPAPKRTRVQNYQRRPQQQRAGRWRVPSAENEDDEDRRNQHNNMERQRRIGLKNLFDQLKLHVPVIAGKEKVAKVVILKQALSYVDTLNKSDNTTKTKLTLLQEQQDILKQRLRNLQRKMR